MKKLLTITTIVAGAMFFHPPAFAGPNPPVQPLCQTGDVSFTIGNTVYHPSACATDIFTANAHDPVTETAELNTAFGNNPLFLFAAKDDGTSNTLLGIKFTLSTVTTNQAGTIGTWTVGWTDVGGPLNLPVSVSMDIGIDGGGIGDGYAFSDVMLPINPNTGTGNFTITFINNGGNNPGLSQMVLDIGQEVQVTPFIIDAPEPMSVALLGVGLLGTLVAAKRRR